jgi:hypothetical protein
MSTPSSTVPADNSGSALVSGEASRDPKPARMSNGFSGRLRSRRRCLRCDKMLIGRQLIYKWSS